MNANIHSSAFLHLNYVAAYGYMTFNVSSASLQKRKKNNPPEKRYNSDYKLTFNYYFVYYQQINSSNKTH